MKSSVTELQPAKYSILILYFRVCLPAKKSMYRQSQFCAFDDAFIFFLKNKKGLSKYILFQLVTHIWIERRLV